MADPEGPSAVAEPDDPDDAQDAAQGSATGEQDASPGEQSLGTRSARGFLWSNLGIVTRYGTALVLAAVLARGLTEPEYAVMVALTVIMLYFDTALDLGMGAALVYEQEEGVTKRVTVAFTANVGLSVVLAVLAFLLAPVIAGFFSLEQYTAVFRSLAVIVILTGLTTVPWSLFTRDMAFRQRALTELWRDFTRFFLTIGLVAAGFGAWAIVWGFVASKVVALVLTFWYTRFRPRLAWDSTIVGELFSYAWRMAGNRFLGLLSLNGDYFVVGARVPAQLPLYYQAFRLPEFVMGGQLNAMSAVLFPMYARIRAEGTMAMSDAMYKALRLVALFSIPAGLGLALVARDAFGVMFGTYDPVGIQTMEIISVTGCVVGLGFATGDLLFAIGKPGVLMRINLVMVPTMLVAMWLVGPWGIVWVAVVHLVTAVVFTSVRQLVVNKLVDATLVATLASLVPGLVVGAAMVAVALPVRLLTDEGFWSLVMVGAACAVGALLGLAVSSGARSELTDLVAKLRG